MADSAAGKDRENIFCGGFQGMHIEEGNANLFDSQINMPLYGSMRTVGSSGEDGERVRLVKFQDSDVDDVIV